MIQNHIKARSYFLESIPSSNALRVLERETKFLKEREEDRRRGIKEP